MSTKTNQNRYYVYCYLREDQTPYYIGKGSAKRITEGRHKGEVMPPKDKSRIQIISSNMNELDAFQAEILLIYWYGRVDIGTGILRNKTNGGDGSSGYKWSKERKANHIKALSGRKRGPMPIDIRKKIALAHLDTLKITFCSFCNRDIGGIGNFNKYHGKNCKMRGNDVV